MARIPALWQNVICINEANIQNEAEKKEELLVLTLYSVALKHDYTCVLLTLWLGTENLAGSFLHPSLS